MTAPSKRKRFLSTEELDSGARDVVRAAGGSRVAAAGGYAMSIYGSDRMTVDLDVLATKMPATLPKLKKLSFGGYVTRTSSGVPVDVIIRDDAMKRLYREAATKAVRVPGIPIRVIQKGHLIAMKMDAGRPKDDLDLQYLLSNMTNDEKTEARRVVVRHLGTYAGRELDALILESEHMGRRDPFRRRRARRHLPARR